MNSSGEAVSCLAISVSAAALVAGRGAARPTVARAADAASRPTSASRSRRSRRCSACPTVAAAPTDQAAARRRRSNFHSAPPPRRSEEARSADEAGQPDASIERRAARRAHEPPRSARQRALLVTEIQGLESLFATTPKNAPDRPQLARRLAEGYVELESAAFRDKTEAEHQGATRPRRRTRAAPPGSAADAGQPGRAAS